MHKDAKAAADRLWGDMLAGMTTNQVKTYGQTCILAYNEYLKEVRHEMLKLANGANKEVGNCMANQLGEILRSYMADKLPEETAMLLWAGDQ